jgi:Dolichyl-phosphate-mannose-protein mannosyltransferase
VAGVISISLGLNFWGINNGLPYVYSQDERSHFVPKAVGFFSSGDFDPGYFLNPPGYTYLLYAVFWAWFRGGDKVLAADPADLFLLARATTAVLGSIVVLLVYLTGRRLFDRSVGLVSAALIAVAFLPVSWAKVAVNDVPALAPLTLALLGAARIVESGRRLDYILAGAGVGLAVGTKYTAGMVVVTVLAAAAVDLRRRGFRALAAVGLGVLGALAAFVVVNPYSVLDPQEYFSSSGIFSVAPQGDGKLGQAQENGILYYLWVFSWGIGWLPIFIAAAGAVILVRRRSFAAILLIPAPALYVIFMGIREAYFGRYLLPTFPFVALLAGYGLCSLTYAVFQRRRRLLLIALGLGVAALSAQSLIHDVHANRVLTQTSTRERAVSWMLANIPQKSLIALEQIYLRLEDSPASRDGGSLRWRLFRSPPPYLASLNPGLLDTFERKGVCYVVTGSTQKGRALREPEVMPEAVAYYRALEQRGELVYRASPYKEGADPVPFNFDWSGNYYPLAYATPGPEIDIYRLNGKGCT